LQIASSYKAPPVVDAVGLTNIVPTIPIIPSFEKSFKQLRCAGYVYFSCLGEGRTGSRALQARKLAP
jgi:hypothetical protein